MSATDLSMAMPMSVDAPKGRVLCVDDEPNILRALCWLLQKEFEVVTAASGPEALELLGRDDFDVIISDHRMPEMGGVDFLTRAKAVAPRAMRILLTGYSDLDAVLQSVNEAEIFRYVTKPWNVTELPRVVGQAAAIARSQPAVDAWPGSDRPHAAGEARVLLLGDDIRVHATVELCAGDLAEVVHVTNVADAIHQLQDERIAVIVAETSLGSVDLTRLLCVLKQRHPQVVSVVLAEEAATDTVARLVNQGQIFRFLPKPLPGSRLRETLGAALAKSREIRQHPGLARRHEVEALGEDELARLRADLEAAARSGAKAKETPASSLGSRMSGFLRRFFADAGSHA